MNKRRTTQRSQQCQTSHLAQTLGSACAIFFQWLSSGGAGSHPRNHRPRGKKYTWSRSAASNSLCKEESNHWLSSSSPVVSLISERVVWRSSVQSQTSKLHASARFRTPNGRRKSKNNHFQQQQKKECSKAFTEKDNLQIYLFKKKSHHKSSPS